MPRNDLARTLEDLIDAHTLADVLEALVEIASEKADHLASEWQDQEQARRWKKAANAVMKAAYNVFDI
jgi:predicted TPR repeat methyltransferase